MRTIAFVSIAVTATAIWTAVKCPRNHHGTTDKANNTVMSVPGQRVVEPRPIEKLQDASGRGPVVMCRQCRQLVEVIVHG